MDRQEESRIVEKVLMASVIEQRKSRRWKIFFFSLFCAYIIFISLIAKQGVSSDGMPDSKGEHVAVINITTAIMNPSIVKDITTELKKAEENENARAILLRINSPGGTSVQSRIVYEELIYWRGKNQDKKIYAVIEDIGASGAYLIASGADKIYADRTSLVGSIGTAFSSFGVDGLMDKLGVERRLITSGKLKGIFDPFSPMTEEDKDILQKIANQGHESFIDDVKNGRGEALLAANDPAIYSGRVWTGMEAKKLGLIDDFGYIQSIVRNEFDNIPIVEYKKKYSFMDSISSVDLKFSNVKAILGRFLG